MRDKKFDEQVVVNNILVLLWKKFSLQTFDNSKKSSNFATAFEGIVADC